MRNYLPQLCFRTSHLSFFPTVCKFFVHFLLTFCLIQSREYVESMSPYAFMFYWWIKQTDKFTFTVRNYEGIMFSLPLQISNICVSNYILFQHLLQSLHSCTSARAIFQEYAKFEGDFIFDIFPAAWKPPANFFYVRHILGISGKVFSTPFLVAATLKCSFA